MVGQKAQEDAETVRLLREAGAIPLLVSNTPELCMHVETVNRVTGRTNNPYDLRRTPGGSSGGEDSWEVSGCEMRTTNPHLGQTTLVTCVGFLGSFKLGGENNQLPFMTNKLYDLTKKPQEFLGKEVRLTHPHSGQTILATCVGFLGVFRAALLGSAASVISIGSDICGSLRIPALFCGIFGHKPTPGVISLSGHVPTSSDKLWPKVFVIGPMVRYAEDLPLMMRILANENCRQLRLDEPHHVLLPVQVIRICTKYAKKLGMSKVEFKIRIPVFAWRERLENKFRKNQPQYTQTGFEPQSPMSSEVWSIVRLMALTIRPLNQVDLSSLKIYFLEDDSSVVTDTVQPDIKMAMRKVINHMKTKYNVTAQQMDTQGLRNSLVQLSVPLLKMDDVTDVFQKKSNPKETKSMCIEVLKYLMRLSDISPPVILYGIIRKFSIATASDRERTRMNENNGQLKKHLKELLSDNAVFLYPTATHCAPFHREMYHRILNVTLTIPCSTLGLPATSCPVGLNDKGLPVGIQVIAGPCQDRLCLALAKEIETAFGGWIPPP
uniref:Amidase domain-containing protein n=1 Tax=Timema genevievae TaxID=629358 RepID=A0A7R9JQL5_TIMGE|nr:unnamed protein product [Timema genevievae]